MNLGDVREGLRLVEEINEIRERARELCSRPWMQPCPEWAKIDRALERMADEVFSATVGRPPFDVLRSLSKTEVTVFQFLYAAEGGRVTRKQLETAVWPQGIGEDSVERTIKRLRRKIEGHSYNIVIRKEVVALVAL
jgi:DNA-binding response OmpR family regulator